MTAGIPQLAVLTAIGGLLVVLALAIGGWQIADSSARVLADGFSWLRPDSWAAALLRTGNLALDMVGLAIALYTAYGIAGQRALVPALIGGIVATTLDTGYLGGLAAGVIAGGSTWALQKFTADLKSRLSVVRGVVPLASTLVTALVFLLALVAPQLIGLHASLSDQLVTLELTNHRLLLGLLLGLVVCGDLGGPASKTAYGYAVAGISIATPTPDHLTFMAVVVAAGMVPPLGMALATVVRGKLFTPAERNFGRVSWLFGVAGITEGAVPFALADPLRVIPATMAGGAVAGALTMKFGSTMAFPHGGFFAVSQLGKPLLLAAAVAAGVLLTATLAVLLKSLPRIAPVRATAGATPARTREKVPATA